jgi:hypothetical protein
LSAGQRNRREVGRKKRNPRRLAPAGVVEILVGFVPLRREGAHDDYQSDEDGSVERDDVLFAFHGGAG